MVIVAVAASKVLLLLLSTLEVVGNISIVVKLEHCCKNALPTAVSLDRGLRVRDVI